MKYKAFLGSILVLGLLGTVLVLLQQRQGLRTQVSELEQAQSELPPPVDINEPTELVVTGGDSLYEGERLERKSYRCEYGNCLFSGEGGLVGMAAVDGFYTTTLRSDFDGNEVSCQALYIKRGPAELAEDSKFSQFFGDKKGVLVIPVTRENVAHASDWEAFLRSAPNAPIQATIFLRDSLEMGVGPCESGMHLVDVQAL